MSSDNPEQQQPDADPPGSTTPPPQHHGAQPYGQPEHHGDAQPYGQPQQYGEPQQHGQQPQQYGPPGGSYPPAYGSYGGGPPGPPAPQGRRFSTPYVILGTNAGLVGPGLVTALANQVSDAVHMRLGGLGLLSIFVLPGLGLVLAVMQGPPERRGFGLGLVIGPVLGIIVLAGLCIALIASYASGTS